MSHELIDSIADLIDKTIEQFEGVKCLLDEVLNIETFSTGITWYYYDLTSHSIIHSSTNLIEGYRRVIYLLKTQPHQP